jgi:general secretion pathway protein F
MGAHTPPGSPQQFRVANTSHQLDDFAALYDEIAALVRAKVPLERGMVRLVQELPRGAAIKSAAVGAQLSAGQSLEQALDDPRLNTPPVFRAALRAGLRSGRLAESLESISLAARRMSDLRRSVGLSLIYPTMLLCVALLQVPLLAHVLSIMVAWMRDGKNTIPSWLLYFENWSDRRIGWWIAIPSIIVLLFLLTSALSGAGLVRGGWRTELFRMLPWVRGAIDNARRAHFSDQLSLLVEHGVPLGESLRIASDATVDPGLRRDALAGADAIERGESLRDICAREGAFTPTLRWLMGGGASNETLARSLRHAAETYQRRAIASADLARIYLPGLLTVLIGGGVVTTLALLVMWPWTNLWYQIVR